MKEIRFKFGENWRLYASNNLLPDNIDQAKADFHRLLEPEDLSGKTFLDVGFGQGLALAIAAGDGADVFGIDIDPDCLDALNFTGRRFDSDLRLKVATISIFDPGLDAILPGKFRKDGVDVVHSWGVLHHTGDLFRAIEICVEKVRPGGLFVLAVYNQHWSSPIWRIIKKLYVNLPENGRKLLICLVYPIIFMAKFIVTRKNPFKKERGMNFYRDIVDWVGGYPYEFTSPEVLRNKIEGAGFTMIKFFPARVPTGCNEFVFKKCRQIPLG